MNIRYILISAAIFVLFANFIACGGQFYQVSMEQDVDAKRVSAEAARVDSPIFGIHAPGGWDLPISYKAGDDLRDDQVVELKAAMAIWEKVVGRKLFAFQGKDKGVTGNSFPDLYSSLKDSVNGNYMDDPWSKTKKPETVLATTIWDNDATGRKVAKADIRYNSDKFIFGDAMRLRPSDTKEIVDLRSLALHEVGHLLGLAHVTSDNDKYSVMNPSLFIGEGLTYRCPSKGDVERMQKIYGCEGDTCSIDSVMQALAKDSASCKQNT